MIIDCISDLHGSQPKLEGGDLLIIAGDLTASDKLTQYFDFSCWIAQQEYKKKIVIGGNHDNILQANYGLFKRIIDFEYLCDSGTEFEGLKIWGSPWTLKFPGMNPHCKAFTVDTEEDLFLHFGPIPIDTDILITHSPPFGIGDGIPIEDGSSFHVGSKSLDACLRYCYRPRLHVFGHIHEGYGIYHVFTDCISINASHVDGEYTPVNQAIRIIL